MRIIQRYILKEHIAPFFFAFFTVTFLLVIDYVPRIIDHVIDKDISIWIALELVGLNLAWMLALSIPMSVLVATLMAFGRLSSDFEITAIKASGISLIYILLPLLLAGALLTFGMVQFHDQVLPDVNKKARQLWGDIAAMRPTLSFESGVFIADVPGYLILIDDIDHTTSRVEGVKITETKISSKPRLIIADYGYLEVVDGGLNMQFTLYNGELHSLDVNEPESYRKLDFDKQVINVADAGSELQRTDSEYRTDREMNIAQMQENVDRTLSAMHPIRQRIIAGMYSKFDYLFADSFASRSETPVADSVALFAVQNDAAAFKRLLERNRQQLATHHKLRNKYEIEIHKKYSIPAASLAFILIGAPLGILARRGGMGVAIAISIFLFMVYWAFLIGGEDLADRGKLHPFWAMWSANILMCIIGTYLTYIVATEKPLFAWFRKIN